MDKKIKSTLISHGIGLGVILLFYIFNEAQGSCYGNCYIGEGLSYAFRYIFCIIGSGVILVHGLTSIASIKSPFYGKLIANILWGIFGALILITCLKNLFYYIRLSDPLYTGNMTFLSILSLGSASLLIYKIINSIKLIKQHKEISE